MKILYVETARPGRLKFVALDPLGKARVFKVLTQWVLAPIILEGTVSVFDASNDAFLTRPRLELARRPMLPMRRQE